MPLNLKHFVCRSCSDWGKVHADLHRMLDTGPETDATEDKQLLQENRQLNNRILADTGLVMRISFQRSQLPSPLSVLKCCINSTQHNFTNHWTVSQLLQGEVYHYHSLQANSIAPELRKQLIALYTGATLQITQPQVQVQRGS